MTILGKNILNQHGPYVDFAVLDAPIPLQEGGWPTGDSYERGVFFEMADDLLGCYCRITQSYSPFDPYDLTQLRAPQAIYEFAAQLLLWELQISRTRASYFNGVWDYLYCMDDPQLDAQNISPEKLKADLLETLHFIVEHLYQAAALEKCVVIVGF